MSGPCTDCGGPDYRTLEARIDKLEAENEEWIGYFDACYMDMCHYKDRAEQAEAELARLKSGLLHNKTSGGRPEMGTK